MTKTPLRFLTLLAGILFCGIAFAQQSSAPSTQQPSAAKPATPAPKTQKSAAEPAKKPANSTLETARDKASYAIGMNIGKSMKRDAVDLDPDIVARGMKDALSGNQSLLTDEEIQAILTNLQNDVRKHQQEAFQQVGEKNKKDGEAFLAANKDKPGVVSLPSGLQYKIVQPGDGPKPTAADTVVCNYRGTLVDGTEFDSSYKRGQPATFPVGQVIKGWTEALQLMPVGSKWQLFIPPGLAYGERGTGANGPIGPNETLIFEVELLSIQAKPEAKPAPAPAAQPQAQPQSKPH
jgi:FKBP-type peptidyl-prolyl cis-trans isomerase